MGFRCDFPGINCEQCDENYETDLSACGHAQAGGIEYNCDNCELPALLQENREAWEIYQTINSQFVYDFHALPLVFDIYGMRCTREEAKGLLNKLILIHGMITEDARQKQSTDHTGS